MADVYDTLLEEAAARRARRGLPRDYIDFYNALILAAGRQAEQEEALRKQQELRSSMALSELALKQAAEERAEREARSRQAKRAADIELARLGQVALERHREATRKLSERQFEALEAYRRQQQEQRQRELEALERHREASRGYQEKGLQLRERMAQLQAAMEQQKAQQQSVQRALDLEFKRFGAQAQRERLVDSLARNEFNRQVSEADIGGIKVLIPHGFSVRPVVNDDGSLGYEYVESNPAVASSFKLRFGLPLDRPLRPDDIQRVYEKIRADISATVPSVPGGMPPPYSAETYQTPPPVFESFSPSFPVGPEAGAPVAQPPAPAEAPPPAPAPLPAGQPAAREPEDRGARNLELMRRIQRILIDPRVPPAKKEELRRLAKEQGIEIE